MANAKIKMKPQISDWDVMVIVWQRLARGKNINAIVRHFELHAGEEGYPECPPDRQSISRVCKRLLKLPPELVCTLPLEVQGFVCEHRPDLKQKLEFLQRGKTFEAVPRELIPTIKKLAKRLQWLIRVPEPERPLLTEEMIKGNEGPYLTVVRTINTPWWCVDPSICVYLDLNAEQQALFNRFVSLPASQKFKTIFDEWVRTTNAYLHLVRAGGDKTQIKQAYEEAKQVEHEAHLELWKAVEALYQSN